ncbi:MAG: APC family permease [bacterium]
MSSNNPADDNHQPHLIRRFGLLQATALNMSNMVGVGPFITIPLLMSAMGGPQALLGWIFAALICIPDGMIWSELGAAMPKSGGTYRYLIEGYGRARYGRLMGFLFIWQFILSGPLEIASGYIGFGKYLNYIWASMTPTQGILTAAGVGVLNIILLYRRISFIGMLTVSLWVGMLITTGSVIFTGAFHFDPKIAFDFPPNAFNFTLGFFLGLGSAMRVGIYDYLGYYDICYIGDEVRDPGRVIPRSIIISLIGVAIIYMCMNLSIIGIVSWREFVPANDQNPTSNYLVSILMERVYGPKTATVITVMIMWTSFASVFALLLGYSRIPYAAALDGYFFRIFGRVHPTKNFPHISLLAIGIISILACFLSLQTVIDALVTCRILVQFIGQIFAVILLRRNAPAMPRPYRVWLYPLPCLMALVGWVFVFITSESRIILFSLGVLVLGILAFYAWSFWTRRWPFAAEGN